MSFIPEVLSRYGSKAYYVLKAAIEIAEENRRLGLVKFGDFDYKSLISRLKSWGIEYNPSGLLRILERDYGIVKTVYRSSSQRWWVFSDLDLIKLVMSESGDSFRTPDEELLNIQIAVLDVDRVMVELSDIILKEKAGSVDDRKLRDIVFNELPVIIKVYKKALEYGDRYSEFVGKVRRVLELTRRAALLRNGLRANSKTILSLGSEHKAASPARLKCSSAEDPPMV